MSGSWSRIAALFDELSELDSVTRRRRLEEISQTEPEVAEPLAAMLAADQAEDDLLDVGGLIAELVDGQARPQWETQSGTRLGTYRLLERLGEGGMGEVWRAERADGTYRHEVAIKLLKRGLDTQGILRRFVQERAILARLDHPGIVRLIDGGMSESGQPWYAMEAVEGQTITAWSDQQHLGLRERVELLIQVCEAVAYAHGRLVIHRDLKPANILVDATGRPRLLDFGIAKLLEDSSDEELTRTGVRVLSPAYAAPEQLMGQPVSVATDVYALAVVLFQLVTGELPRPRTAKTTYEEAGTLSREQPRLASRALRERVPGSLRQRFGAVIDGRRLIAQVRGDLDLILATALRPEPDRRYPSVSDFAADLRAWLDNRPITARPDSAAYRSRRFVRRHLLGVTATAAAMVALLIGLGAALWQAEIARDLAVRAEAEAARATAQALRADQTRDFIVAAFGALNPAVSRDGVQLSLGDFLVSTIERLDDELADAPESRLELRLELASALTTLGREQQARPELEQVLEALRAGAVRVDPGREVQALHLLAMIEQRTGAAEAALAHINEALEVAQALDALPERLRLQRISARTTQASLASDRGDYRGALEQYLSVREDRLAHLGVEDHRMAVDWLNLCAMRYYLAEYPQAEADCRHADHLLASDPQAPQVRRAWVGNSLGLVLTQQGRYDEAEAVLASSKALVEQYLGAEHPMRGTLMANLLGVHLWQGRLALIQDGLSELERIDPQARLSPFRRSVRLGFQGRVALALGDAAQAETLLTEALQLAEAADSLHANPTLRTRRTLAETLLVLGRHEQAMAQLDELLALYPALGRSEHDEFAWTLLLAARIQAARADLEQATEFEREGLALLARTAGVQHPRLSAPALRAVAAE